MEGVEGGREGGREGRREGRREPGAGVGGIPCPSFGTTWASNVC